jgi:hypothetical protein
LVLFHFRHRTILLASFPRRTARHRAASMEILWGQWQICTEQHLPVQSNHGLVSTTILGNASSSVSLFALPDMVGVLTLCRGDMNVPGRTSAVRVSQGGDICYLRFSNRNFLAGAHNDEMKLLNYPCFSSSLIF